MQGSGIVQKHRFSVNLNGKLFLAANKALGKAMQNHAVGRIAGLAVPKFEPREPFNHRLKQIFPEMVKLEVSAAKRFSPL